jgi:hypothetical protein
MTIYTFTKRVDVRRLHYLLTAAGYAVNGITYDDGSQNLIVDLAASESKNPTTIVNNYVYRAPIIIDWKAEYSKATTAAARINVIAKRLNLVDLTETEMFDGKLV